MSIVHWEKWGPYISLNIPRQISASTIHTNCHNSFFNGKWVHLDLSSHYYDHRPATRQPIEVHHSKFNIITTTWEMCGYFSMSNLFNFRLFCWVRKFVPYLFPEVIILFKFENCNKKKKNRLSQTLSSLGFQTLPVYHKHLIYEASCI